MINYMRNQGFKCYIVAFNGGMVDCMHSCQKRRFKQLNFNYMYLISYKIAKDRFL